MSGRGRALVVTAALAVAGLTTAGGAEASVKQGPTGLAFYQPPNKVPKKPGKAIWTTAATGSVPLQSAGSTQLLLYTSRTARGKRITASGSVAVPPGSPPPGGWPVIDYAHATTGVADPCTPSQDAPGGPIGPYVSYINPLLNSWLAAGYAVVRTDYQGLGPPGRHPYLIGKPEGLDVIYMLKAARQLDPDIGNRFLLAGHSQGGQASLFAAGLAKKTAPKLKLRGSVGFAPASHMLDGAKALPTQTQPSSASALAAYIVYGASVASKSVVPTSLLSDQALALFPQLDTACNPQLFAAFEALAPAQLPRPGGNLSPLYKVLKDQNPDVKTKAPILLAQGTDDATVPKAFSDSLNQELLAKGDTVDYKVYPGVGHSTIPFAAANDALSFFQSRLPATPPSKAALRAARRHG